MSSARSLTDIPTCMRMSFIYPWENSPEKEISDPLSYDLPDITSDFEAIYGEGAAKLFFPLTPTTGDNLPPVLQDDSSCADVFFFGLFGPEPTPELQSQTESSPASSLGYASDPSSLSSISPSPSPKHGVQGGKKGRQTTINNARTLCLPYKRHPSDPTTSPAFRPGRPDYSRSPPSPPFSSPSTSSSVPSNPDDVLTPEFMHSLQIRPPGTPMAGPSSLPKSQDPALSVSQRPALLPEIEAFANRYCRYPNCNGRFSDKRTTERHRLTHLDFGTYVCPNPACATRTKARPHFASDFSLGRHLRMAADDSPCAVGKGRKLSSFRRNAAQAEALIQQALVPFDPATHAPF